jgi:hypothetical protein
MKTLNQFNEETGYLKVKNPDEQKFIDKHTKNAVADANGNGDEVFKASNVKKSERKKERHGYEPGEDESVYEEAEQVDEYLTFPSKKNPLVPLKQHSFPDDKKAKKDKENKQKNEEVEQIDELSTPTLQSYRKKARAQGNDIVAKMKMGGGDWSKDQKDTKTLRKRSAGAQMSGKTLRKRGESLNTEEVDLFADLPERIQDLMYSTLDRLNEDNQEKFMAACQTVEGLEKMIAFAIENRGD